jgi:hypothetical protein
MNVNRADPFDLPDKPAARLPLVRAVGIWIGGLPASGVIGGFAGSMLDGPHSAHSGMVWGTIDLMLSSMVWGAIGLMLSSMFWGALLGMLVFAYARLWLASEPDFTTRAAKAIWRHCRRLTARLIAISDTFGKTLEHALEGIGANVRRAKMSRPSLRKVADAIFQGSR